MVIHVPPPSSRVLQHSGRGYHWPILTPPGSMGKEVVEDWLPSLQNDNTYWGSLISVKKQLLPTTYKMNQRQLLKSQAPRCGVISCMQGPYHYTPMSLHRYHPWSLVTCPKYIVHISWCDFIVISKDFPQELPHSALSYFTSHVPNQHLVSGTSVIRCLAER